MRLCCVLCSSAELRQKKLFLIGIQQLLSSWIKNCKQFHHMTLWGNFYCFVLNGTSPVYHFNCFMGKGSFMKYFF